MVLASPYMTAIATVVAIGAILGPAIGAYVAFKVGTVHKLVNEKSDVQDARIAQLAEGFISAGIEVPATTKKTGAS